MNRFQELRNALLLASVAMSGWVTGMADQPVSVETKQVVILYTHRPVAPICAEWDRGIRNALASQYSGPLDFEIEYLNLARYQDPDYIARWLELLRAKYGTKSPDVIIPVYVPAVQFALTHRDSIFPDVPLVFCSIPPKLAERARSQTHVTGVTFRLDFMGTLAAMQSLHPGTRRLLVVSGCSVEEAQLMAVAREELRRLDLNLNIEFLEGIPFDQLKQTLGEANHDSAVLLLSYDEDMNGRHYMTSEIVESLVEVCPLPIYGLYDTLLGRGIVGGSLVSAEGQGHLAGCLAAQILSGQRPETLDVVGLGTAQPMFDGRQLRRWSLSEANLPPHSQVLFREPTFWEQFGNFVLMGVAAVLLQSLIIAGLVVNRSRRMRAEREAKELSGLILTAQEDERRYLAREMHDDLSQRLAASAITAGNLEIQNRPLADIRHALGSLKSSLIAICNDMHRLSRQIHPAILDDFGLAHALRAECDRIQGQDGMEMEFLCGHLPADLPKPTELCLYRIAQEALWNAARHSQSDRVRLEVNSDPEFVHLEVRDFGIGFQPDLMSSRGGLGLASMKERTRLVRGTFKIESTPGKGTRISVRIPLIESKR